MKIKLLASIALLGLSVGSAQAITLNFSDSHTADGEVDHFKFNVNSTGSVSLWTDTLRDGFDSAGSLFKLSSATGKYDYFSEIANADQVKDIDGLNQSGVNAFNVAMKNGWDLSLGTEGLGVSDTGGTFNLDAGSYLFAVAGFAYLPNAFLNGGGTLDDGYIDSNIILAGGVLPEAQWSTWKYNTGGAPSSYNAFIEGDVSLPSPAPVPVPAAVWLFASAIVGLGATGRGRKQG